jgi:hypothetical protein
MPFTAQCEEPAPVVKLPRPVPTKIFTDGNELEAFESELVLSKLSNSLRSFSYQRNGETHIIIIGSGCPVAFREFNIILAYMAVGHTHLIKDEVNDDIKDFWLAVGYRAFEKDQKNYGLNGIGEYFHAQDCVMGALHPDWKEGADALPELKLLDEQLTYSHSSP